MGDVSQLTPAVGEPAAGAAGQAGARRFFGRLVREQPLGTAGGIVILFLLLVSIFADGLAPYRFEEIHLRDRLQAPSAQYLLGTDHVGRDRLSRLIHGRHVGPRGLRARSEVLNRPMGPIAGSQVSPFVLMSRARR